MSEKLGMILHWKSSTLTEGFSSTLPFALYIQDVIILYQLDNEMYKLKKEVNKIQQRIRFPSLMLKINTQHQLLLDVKSDLHTKMHNTECLLPFIVDLRSILRSNSPQDSVWGLGLNVSVQVFLSTSITQVECIYVLLM